MADSLDELLTRAFLPPPDDGTLPAFLEFTSGAFIAIDDATADQLSLAAKLHREIARRHQIQAGRLDAAARERRGGRGQAGRL